MRGIRLYGIAFHAFTQQLYLAANGMRLAVGAQGLHDNPCHVALMLGIG